MYKNSIAILLTVLFTVIISAPTVVIAIDDSIDVSILFSCTEEEEKESEKTKTFELTFSESSNETISFAKAIGQSPLSYRFKTYSKPHLYLICPPPEFI
jgi:hypothetical protein